MMQVYKVGGAVRDKLLGLPVKEQDWVVVGATPEMMAAKGFKAVGKDFPVFLHPETGEEYALARTERKKGHGYKGFVFHTGKNVTLEEDLERRDLTINAMAETPKGKIIDPFGGQKDLKNKQLHHVSDAFVEDPLRVLRTARFAAKLPDFNVHPDTQQLMQMIVQQDELSYLEPQRVWKEIERALAENKPARFFQVLINCDAFHILFPQIKTPKRSLEQIKVCHKLTRIPEILWAAFTYHSTLDAIQQLNQRYNIPRQYSELSLLTAKSKTFWNHLETQSPEAFIQWLERMDAFRRSERFDKLLVVCRACVSDGEKKAKLCQRVYQNASEVTAQPYVQQGLKGSDIAKAIHKARVEAVRDLVS